MWYYHVHSMYEYSFVRRDHNPVSIGWKQALRSRGCALLISMLWLLPVPALAAIVPGDPQVACVGARVASLLRCFESPSGLELRRRTIGAGQRAARGLDAW